MKTVFEVFFGTYRTLKTERSGHFELARKGFRVKVVIKIIISDQTHYHRHLRRLLRFLRVRVFGLQRQSGEIPAFLIQFQVEQEIRSERHERPHLLYCAYQLFGNKPRIEAFKRFLLIFKRKQFQIKMRILDQNHKIISSNSICCQLLHNSSLRTTSCQFFLSVDTDTSNAYDRSSQSHSNSRIEPKENNKCSEKLYELILFFREGIHESDKK